MSKHKHNPHISNSEESTFTIGELQCNKQNNTKRQGKKCKKGNRTVKQEAIKYQQAQRSAPSSVAMVSREACVR